MAQLLRSTVNGLALVALGVLALLVLVGFAVGLLVASDPRVRSLE
jgi:hypothetical protein|eukprot:COSAG01_NODE_312_length_19063_cov_207.879825_8_plen_45_part_00